MKSHDKMEDFEDFVSKYQFENHEILFMGDDIPDKYVMEKVGIAACPINAVPEVKRFLITSPISTEEKDVSVML